MGRWLARLAVLGLSITLVGAFSGRSAAPVTGLPLAGQLPYEKPTEGLSLLYPATWEIAESPTDNGHWVAWYDPRAQEVPPGRIHLNGGAKIELQVFHFLPPVGVEAHLQLESELSDSVLSSGALTVGGVDAFFIETSSGAAGGTRTRTVSFIYDNRWYHITLAIFDYSDLLVGEANTYVSEFDRLVTSINLQKPFVAKMPGLASPQFLIRPAAEQLTVQQGWYYHPDVGGGLHKAIDYVDGPVNTPATAFGVDASANGVATYFVGWNGGLGNYVSVRHNVNGQTYYTIYAHLASSTLPVGVETNVSAGQQIGIAGTSGDTGSYRHLHFALYHDINGTNRSDPYDIYNNRDFYPLPCGGNLYWTQCPPIRPGDFNGDGCADVLVRRSSGYLTGYWGNCAGGIDWPSELLPGGAGWGTTSADKIAGPGDFNGDGCEDVLKRSSDGYLKGYWGDCAGGIDWPSEVLPGGAGWGKTSADLIVGPGDFNGDGCADVLKRSSDGYLKGYWGDCAGGIDWPSELLPGGAGWGTTSADLIVGPGDFNGDGCADLLVRRSSGRLYGYWGNCAGGIKTWSVDLGGGAGWGTSSADLIVGPGDFNGDGCADVLKRTSGGYLRGYWGDCDDASAPWFRAWGVDLGGGAGWGKTSADLLWP